MKNAKTRLALAALAMLLCLSLQPASAQDDDPTFEDLSVTLDQVKRAEIEGVVGFVPMTEIQIAKLLDEAEAVAVGKTQATTEFMDRLMSQYKAFRGAYDQAMFQVHPKNATEAKDLESFEAREDWGKDDDALFAAVLDDQTGVKPELLRAIVSGYWELVVSFMQRDVLDSMPAGVIPTYKSIEGAEASPLEEDERLQATANVKARIPATIAQLRKVLVAE